MHGPRFPAEILRTIFQFATHVPHRTCSTLPGPLETARRKRKYLGLYTSTLKTKMNLVLVCKAWRTIVLPLLYEDIRLGMRRFIPDEVVKRLADVFRASRTTKHDGHGRWTRRIDIGAVNFASAPFVAALLQLLQGCPKLEIFIVYRTLLRAESTNVVNKIGCLIASRLHKSIRRLECLHDGSAHPHHTRPYYGHPNIDTLAMAFCDLPANGRPTSLPIKLSKLTSLTIYATAFKNSDDFNMWSFPALKHLTLIDVREEDFKALVPFFDKHGPHMKSLAFTQSQEEEFPLKMDHLHHLLIRAPSVEEFVYDMISMSSFILPRAHPSITRLGLKVSYHKGYTAPNIHTLIPALCANFPRLACVRLLDYLQPCSIPLFARPSLPTTLASAAVAETPDDPDATKKVETSQGVEMEAARAAKSWRVFVREWRERRVRFEDVDGRSMRENLPVVF